MTHVRFAFVVLGLAFTSLVLLIQFEQANEMHRIAVETLLTQNKIYLTEVQQYESLLKIQGIK